jgi:hypothetical protein
MNKLPGFTAIFIKGKKRAIYLYLWNIITNTNKNCKISLRKEYNWGILKFLFSPVVSDQVSKAGISASFSSMK